MSNIFYEMARRSEDEEQPQLPGGNVFRQMAEQEQANPTSGNVFQRMASEQEQAPDIPSSEIGREFVRSTGGAVASLGQAGQTIGDKVVAGAMAPGLGPAVNIPIVSKWIGNKLAPYVKPVTDKIFGAVEEAGDAISSTVAPAPENSRLTGDNWKELLKDKDFYGMSVAQAVPYMAATAAGSLLGGPAGGLLTAGALEGGAAVREYEQEMAKRGEPVDPAVAEKIFVGVGAINAPLEYLPIKKVIDRVPGAQKLFRRIVTQGITEGVTEALQESTNMLAADIGYDKKVQKEDLWQLVQAAIGGALMGGGMGVFPGAGKAPQDAPVDPNAGTQNALETPTVEQGIPEQAPVEEVAPVAEDVVPQQDIETTLNERTNEAQPVPVPAVGLSVDVIDEAPPAGEDIGNPSKYFDEETAAEIEASRGKKPDSFMDTVKEQLTSLGHKMTRDFEHLARSGENAPLRRELYHLAAQREVSSHLTLEALRGVTAPLSSNEFDLFTWKVLTDDARESATRKEKFPFFEDEAAIDRAKEMIDRDVSVSPKVQSALEARAQLRDDVTQKNIDAMKEIGVDVESRFKRKDYFRHQVLEYAKLKGITGTGDKLKTPKGRSHMKRRKGSKMAINTDYLQAEHEVLAQMMYDTEVAKAISSIDKQYNVHEELKKEARRKANKDKTWRDLMEERGGLVEWRPDESNVFFLADSIPAKLAEKLTDGTLESLGITKDDLRKIKAVGGKRKPMVLPENIALTLDNMTKERSTNPIAQGHRFAIRNWKVWQLLSPRRIIKYKTRNFTGDSEAFLTGNPSATKKIPKSVKDIYKHFYQNRPMEGELKEWFTRGGFNATLQAQELDDPATMHVFKSLYKGGKKSSSKNLWKKYWKGARKFNDATEAVLRYATYLDYLDQMQKNKDGKPNNWGASKPEEIMALKDIRDRAYWMANDMLGAYDRISAMGKAFREHAYPFWSWKETNARRYMQMFRNVAADKKVAGAVGRKLGIKAPMLAIKAGAFYIKASAFLTLVNVFNHTVFPDEEEELPESVRMRPHIVLGRGADGEVDYFSRIGAFGDILDWFGLDTAPYLIYQVMTGKKQLKEATKDWFDEDPWKATPNIMVQGMLPFVKLAGEILTKRSLFPDIFEPRPIRDWKEFAARSFGVADEYKAVTGKPSRGYDKSLKNLYKYSVDTGEAAYNDAISIKMRWLKEQGKSSDGFGYTAKVTALYNMKLAIRYGDKAAQKKYLAEYLSYQDVKTRKDLRKIRNSINRSLERMAPLGGMTKEDQRAFIRSLTEEEKERFRDAYRFYGDIMHPSDTE